MARLTSYGTEDDFYMADSFNRDAMFCYSPQGTSSSSYTSLEGCCDTVASTSAKLYSDTISANCCSFDTIGDSISSLTSTIDTKVSCSTFSDSIDKVSNALKQLSSRLGFSLDSNGNIVDEKRKGFKNAMAGRLRREDLLTLRG